MSDRAFDILQRRQTPVVAKYATRKRKEAKRQIIYDGTSLSRFLFQNGISPRYANDFLWENNLAGEHELRKGMTVSIPVRSKTESFAKHKEA